MKTLSEKRATEKLRSLKDDFRAAVKSGWEHRAKDCETCETQGVCCTDAHFVNVHVTRLEAVLIGDELARLSPVKKAAVAERIADSIETYGLSDEGDTFAQTFACPLFEKGTGCLVHNVKPLPCIAHACYERAEDLPPDEVLDVAHNDVERLDERVYKTPSRWLPLPLALVRNKK